MKTNKILFIVAIVFTAVSLHAQNKKVAVMETKNIEGVSAFQSNMVRGGMEVAVANAQGYEGYDRAAFDQIMKEQKFQRSGAVDDKQIREMGVMAGVQYVLVTEASSDGQGFFILAKLLDVETGQYGNVVNTFCSVSGQDIYKASNELGAKLFGGEAETNGGGQDFTEMDNEIVETDIFTIIEEMPDFPGGTQKLSEYLAKNIKYPQLAKECGIQGRVFVNFVVEPDGSVSNVNVMRSLGGGCDEEAMRVVKSMPKWKPGKHRGKPVRVSYILPVNFRLTETGK